MIIILAEGQGFNNSWDKLRPAKNGTASLRVHLSQFTFNETGQRLSGHLGTGSNSPTIRTVMLAQFWSCTWAQIPHCTYCVDLYLGLILGGSQPCPGSEAVAVNEAGSLSCPVSPPDWQITLSAMPPKPRLQSSPPGPEWTSPLPFPAFLRDAGVSRAPVPLRGALRTPAALAAAHAVPWRCHRETGPAALSGGTSAACTGTAAGRDLRAEFLSVSRFSAFFLEAWFAACQMWSRRRLKVQGHVSVTGTPESLTHPPTPSAKLQAAGAGAVRNTREVRCWCGRRYWV